MAEEKKLYTIKEISELSGISESEIIRLVVLKKIDVIRTGRTIRITEQEFDRFLGSLIDSHGNQNKSPATYREDETTLYTAEQVAKILQLSVDNVWLLLKSGKIKGFKIREGRSSWRITAKSLKDFIDSRSRHYAGT